MVTVEEPASRATSRRMRERLVKTLSGGQLRRLDLGLGIIGNPELLILDEPTTGFDPSARREAWDVVRAMTGQGTTIILTTHYMDEADALADRVAVISQGRIVAEGTPAPSVGATWPRPSSVSGWRRGTEPADLPVPATTANRRGTLHRVSGEGDVHPDASDDFSAQTADGKSILDQPTDPGHGFVVGRKFLGGELVSVTSISAIERFAAERRLHRHARQSSTCTGESAVDKRAMATSLFATGPPVPQRASGLHEKIRGRIEIAHVTSKERPVVGVHDRHVLAPPARVQPVRARSQQSRW